MRSSMRIEFTFSHRHQRVASIIGAVLALLSAGGAHAQADPEAQRRDTILRAIMTIAPKLGGISYPELEQGLSANLPPPPVLRSRENKLGTNSQFVVGLVTLHKPQRSHDVVPFDACANKWIRVTTNGVVPFVSINELLESYGPTAEATFLAFERQLIVPGSVLWANGMVLQANMSNTIWGYGVDGDQITVTVSNTAGPLVSLSDKYRTVVQKGKWRFDLVPVPRGREDLTLQFFLNGCTESFGYTNVTAGDVWLFVGDFGARGPEVEISSAESVNLHVLRILPSHAAHPSRFLLTEGWQTGSKIASLPLLQRSFAAQQKALPVGIIVASCGVAYMNAWIPTTQLMTEEMPVAFCEGTPESFEKSGVYNAMLAALLEQKEAMPPPFQNRGIFWVHGGWQAAQSLAMTEGDSGPAVGEYRSALQTLLDGLKFALPAATNYIVQLPNPANVERSASGIAWSGLQQCQFDAGNRNHRAIVPAWDLPTEGIHLTTNGFQKLGERLAKIAAITGPPPPIAVTATGNRIRLTNAGYWQTEGLSGIWFSVGSPQKPNYVTKLSIEGADLLLDLRDGLGRESRLVRFVPHDFPNPINRPPFPIFTLTLP